MAATRLLASRRDDDHREEERDRRDLRLPRHRHGLAAVRGAENAPVLAGVVAIAALGILVGWLSWRRKPAPRLAITPAEIVYGRLEPGMRIRREASPSGRLHFRMGFQGSGWVLLLVDAPDQPGISKLGFDMREVERACVAHGWSFG